jgi:hypothetical protein
MDGGTTNMAWHWEEGKWWHGYGYGNDLFSLEELGGIELFCFTCIHFPVSRWQWKGYTIFFQKHLDFVSTRKPFDHTTF